MAFWSTWTWSWKICLCRTWRDNHIQNWMNKRSHPKKWGVIWNYSIFLFWRLRLDFKNSHEKFRIESHWNVSALKSVQFQLDQLEQWVFFMKNCSRINVSVAFFKFHHILWQIFSRVIWRITYGKKQKFSLHKGSMTQIFLNLKCLYQYHLLLNVPVWAGCSRWKLGTISSGSWLGIALAVMRRCEHRY